MGTTGVRGARNQGAVSQQELAEFCYSITGPNIWPRGFLLWYGQEVWNVDGNYYVGAKYEWLYGTSTNTNVSFEGQLTIPSSDTEYTLYYQLEAGIPDEYRIGIGDVVKFFYPCLLAGESLGKQQVSPPLGGLQIVIQ